MKSLNTKVILKEIKPERGENDIIYEDKDEVKLGKVYLPFKGENVELKKGDEVYFQYGQTAKLNGEELVLVSEGNLLCLK